VDGKPEKKGYRHFNIKTVEGPNDFASMNGCNPAAQRPAIVDVTAVLGRLSADRRGA